MERLPLLSQSKHKGLDDKAAFQNEKTRTIVSGRHEKDKYLQRSGQVSNRQMRYSTRLDFDSNGSASFYYYVVCLKGRRQLTDGAHFNSKLYLPTNLQYANCNENVHCARKDAPGKHLFGEIAVIKLIVRELSTKFAETCDRN